MRREYWQHIRSGEIWAVEIQNDGKRMCGPLHHSDVTLPMLTEYEYDDDEDFFKMEDEFVLHQL